VQVDSEAEAIGSAKGSVQPGGWLNRNVVGMGLTSLLSDAGHEMATAVMASFLAVLGAPVFLSSAVVGLLWSFSPAVGFGYAAVMMLLGAVLLQRVR